ncbi:MAG: DUF5666 domain-containing protein [Woeseiaceae bacterium]|jgi:hypothetical protein|nr:DUF5666 domain-containing protein [Woeseiaceae bacterium]
MNTRMLLALTGALFLAGCGGSSTPPPPPPLPDVSTSDIVTFGTITRFGSVYANGVVYDCNGANVTMNDEVGQLADLRVGHVVAITATIRAREQVAKALTIGCLDEAEGPVSDLDLEDNSFVLLGRTVHFDELTVFENVGYDELANGNVVRVIGHERYQDRIQATHIERIANAWAVGMRMEVKGNISDLDPGLMRFRIGTQWCDYSNAMMELGSADLANGLYVEVKSTSPMLKGDLMLDQVRARDRDRDRDRDRQCADGCVYDLEGYVTEFVSPLDFVVDGAAVTTTTATIYVNGTVDTLANDIKVSITGDFNDEDVLVAERIVFHLPSVVQIEADLEAVDVDSATVTLLGIEVTTDDSTMFRDVSDAAVYEFWLDDLAVGDRIEIRAYLDGATVVATRLERDDAEDTVTLKAPVEAVDRPSLTMLGVSVTARDGTVFQAADKTVIDEEAFFDLVEVGTLVKAVGIDNGAGITADTLFIRECVNSCL